MNHQIHLLHLSDIHFGKKHRFNGIHDPEDLAQRCVKSIQQADLSNPDLVVVTGDIAEMALEQEYQNALKFFITLRTEFGMASNRFVFLPGNHDVNWEDAEKKEKALRKERKSPTEIIQGVDEAKFRHFSRFIEQFHGKKWQEIGHLLKRDAHIYNIDALKISIAAFNSCEHESHAEQFGSISEEQAQAVMNEWRKPEYHNAIKIIGLHHNPNAASEPVVKEGLSAVLTKAVKLAPKVYKQLSSNLSGIAGKPYLEQIIEQKHVHLLLFGHQHVLVKNNPYPWDEKQSGLCQTLSIGSFGLKPESMPENQTDCLQMIDLLIGGESKAKRTILEYKPNLSVADKVKPGGFQLLAGGSSPFALYFTQSSNEETEDNRDPEVIKFAKTAIANLLKRKPDLEKKLTDLLTTISPEAIANELIIKGFSKAWFDLVPLLDRNEVTITDLKEILFWLAAAEACKDMVDSVDVNGSVACTVNARYPVIAEIIVAAKFKRLPRIIRKPFKDKPILAGEDLLFVQETGIASINNENKVLELLYTRFSINPEKGVFNRNNKDLTDNLMVCANSRRPIYIITNDAEKPLSIANLLEFRFKSQEVALNPMHLGETIIYAVLEQILARE